MAQRKNYEYQFNIFYRIIEIIERICLIISIILLVSVILLIFLQIISRYVFSSPYSWTEELARYIFILLSFLGASLALRRYELVAIEFVINKIKAKNKHIIEIISSVFPILFILVFIRSGFIIINLAKVGKTMSPSLQIPMFIIYYIFPFSGIIMLIFAITCFVETLQNDN